MKKYLVITDEEELSLFSEAKKKHKIRLEDIDSHKGLGRSVAASLILNGGVGGALGGYLSKEKANDLDAEREDDHEIKRGATRYSRNVEAIAGGACGALHATRFRNPGLGALSIGVGTGIGALVGHSGAKANVTKRLKKRRNLELGYDEDGI